MKLRIFTPAYNVVFGGLLIIGGLIGYFKSGSAASISAGLIFGNALMLTIWGTDLTVKAEEPEKLNKKRWGYAVAIILSVVLITTFVIRLIGGAKLMPALPIITFSLASVVLNSLVLHRHSLSQ
ncbi:MAG TPA: TMEM14 family protein [Vampirovibrionales bacterium]